MKRFMIIIGTIALCNVAKTQTLQTVTTSGNTTGNAIRIGGESYIGVSGSAELVLGLLTTPMKNDTRCFIGWKNNTNPITNGMAGTLLLQGRSDIANVPIDFATGQGTPQLRMRIGGNGSVGIGTSVPNSNAKLDVNGNIFTSGKIAVGIIDMAKINRYSLAVNGEAIFNKVVVKLYSSWPDYVFSSGYKLPKLDSLEQFIKLNGHLPEVPKADEVEKNGIDLGSNQVLMLKKIEELTLIVIEQNKEKQSLKKSIDDLNKRI